MEISEIIPHIEALIFASEKPLAASEIVELINNAFGFMEERISFDQVKACLEGIREKYQAEFYPFEVLESGGGWQFLTKKEFHKTITQLNGDKFLKRLSNAALETLAIIAYKQPITKGEIESIRGVNTDYSIQKLLEKELIIITGRNEALPGKPLIYTTSKSFMDYFGLNSTADLPKIREVFAEHFTEGTMIRGVEISTEVNSVIETQEFISITNETIEPLAIDKNGDLIKHAVVSDSEEESKQAKEQDSLEEEDTPKESDDTTNE